MEKTDEINSEGESVLGTRRSRRRTRSGRRKLPIVIKKLEQPIKVAAIQLVGLQIRLDLLRLCVC